MVAAPRPLSVFAWFSFSSWPHAQIVPDLVLFLSVLISRHSRPLLKCKNVSTLRARIGMVYRAGTSQSAHTIDFNYRLKIR